VCSERSFGTSGGSASLRSPAIAIALSAAASSGAAKIALAVDSAVVTAAAPFSGPNAGFQTKNERSTDVPSTGFHSKTGRFGRTSGTNCRLRAFSVADHHFSA
jgi:hypothetical protein